MNLTKHSFFVFLHITTVSVWVLSKPPVSTHIQQPALYRPSLCCRCSVAVLSSFNVTCNKVKVFVTCLHLVTAELDSRHPGYKMTSENV